MSQIQKMYPIVRRVILALSWIVTFSYALSQNQSGRTFVMVFIFGLMVTAVEVFLTFMDHCEWKSFPLLKRFFFGVYISLCHAMLFLINDIYVPYAYNSNLERVLNESTTYQFLEFFR
jgi:hypothetical protein